MTLMPLCAKESHSRRLRTEIWPHSRRPKGGYIVTALEFKGMSGSGYADSDEVISLSSGGSPTTGDAYGFDIPWAWFEKTTQKLLVWDGLIACTALWQGKACYLSRNTGGSRPGLTVKGDWGYRSCDSHSGFRYSRGRNARAGVGPKVLRRRKDKDVND